MTLLSRRAAGAGLLLLAALGLGAPGPAQAQWSPPSHCDSAPSTMEIGFCLDRALKAADARLNAAYAQAEARIQSDTTLPAADKAAWLKALRDAERAWIAFRDADCGELIGREWSGGSGMGPAMTACRLDKTERRARELVERYRDN